MSSLAPVRRDRSWPPRLMSVEDAAHYLSLSPTTIRKLGPRPKEVGKRRLYDVRDLDRWADRLNDQPLDKADERKEAEEVERLWLERRGRG